MYNEKTSLKTSVSRAAEKGPKQTYEMIANAKHFFARSNMYIYTSRIQGVVGVLALIGITPQTFRNSQLHCDGHAT